MKKQKFAILCLAGLLLMAGAAFSGCKRLNDSGNSSSVEIIDNRTISVNKTELTLTRGERETLTAHLSVGKGEFTWSSSNEAVVTVSQSGEVCAVEVGTATITVAYEGVEATCTVTVELPNYVPVFKVSEQSIPLWVGSSYSIDGTVTFGGEEVAANVSYISQDSNVATVDENGVVHGIGVGETTVTVKAEYFGLIEQMVVDVTVTEPIIVRTNVQTLELDSITDENVGFSTEGMLSIQVYNQKEEITDDLTYVWEIVGEEIVQINEDKGDLAVTATNVGETKVKVGFTLNGQEYESVFNVIVNRAMYEIPDMIAEDYSGQITMALPEGISIVETPQTIMFGDNETAFVSINDGQIILEKGAFDYSEYEVRIEVGNYGYYAKNVTYCTKVLCAADAANFKALLTENSNGYFVLSENLDFGGAQLAGAIDFSGTIDGRGYALKNFELNYTASNETEGWVSHFIQTNSGTIKNLYLQYTVGSASTNKLAFIQSNTGTVENVKVEVLYNAYAWNTGAIAGSNSGTIKNCVIVIKLGTITEKTHIGVVGVDYNGTYVNNYIVHNGIYDGRDDSAILHPVGETWGGATCTNNYAYSTMADLTAAVTSLPAEDGWSEYWSITNGEVAFGYKEVVADEN